MNFQIRAFFDGTECYDPRKALSLHQAGKISSLFLKRATSYRCPVGQDYGQGWCLLLGSKVKELVGNTSYTFRMLAERNNQTEELTLKDAYVLRSINLSSGHGSGTLPSDLRDASEAFFSPYVTDDDALYLVEFVDQRYYLSRFTTINKCYNVRNPAKQATDREDKINFYRDSMYRPGIGDDEYDAVPWEWWYMLEDIWDEMELAGSLTNSLKRATGNTDYPTKKPENFIFNGISCWDAFHHVVNQLGAVLVFDPVTTTYTLEPRQLRQSLGNLKRLDSRRVFDFEANQFPSAVLPQRFKVHFKREERYRGTEPDIDTQAGKAKSWLPNAVYTKEITTSEVDLSSGSGDDPWPVISTLAGTVEPVWHYAPAYYGPDGELIDSEETETNTDVLAKELVKSIILSRLGDATGRTIYSLIPSAIVPGTEIPAVVWRDYGDKLGLVTEAHSTPGAKETAPATSDWGWSAFGGYSCILGPSANSTGLVRSPSRENRQPTNFSQHSFPVFPQPMQFVMVVNSSIESTADDETDDPTPTADCGVGKVRKMTSGMHAVPGVVVRLDPSLSDDNSNEMRWNNETSVNYNKPGCWIVFPGLRKKPLLDDENFIALLGSVFLAKLAGSDEDGVPIFLASFQQDFICGTLTEDLESTSSAEMTGEDGNTYEVSGRFLDGKILPSGSFVGCHANHFMPSPVNAWGPYWEVIVSQTCPVEPTP